MAGQACIDIASHVIADRGWGMPDQYRETFTVLALHGVIPDTLAARLRDLTGLRNRLVHAYDDIDGERLLAAVPEGLTDLDGFARAIAALLRADEEAAAGRG